MLSFDQLAAGAAGAAGGAWGLGPGAWSLGAARTEKVFSAALST